MSRHAYHTQYKRKKRSRRWTSRFGLDVLRQRWSNAMPKFFKKMMWICGLISGTALAAHESMELAHIQPHAWWLEIEPYLVAVPAGAMFACKFTQNYDRDGKPIKKELPKGDNPSAVNNSDIETAQPVETQVHEMDPYDDD